MSSPDEHSEQGEPEELDLKAETIADLDLPEREEDEIRGGGFCQRSADTIKSVTT